MGESEMLKPGWQRVKFGDVVRLSNARCSDPVSEGIERYVGLEHIDSDDLRIRRWGLVEDGITFTTRFKPGQVLFGKRRVYLRKVAVADFEGICSGDIYVFESTNPRVLLPELLTFICQTERFFEYAIDTSAGSLSPRTNWKSLVNFEFALPPLEEQKKFFEVMNAIENCIESIKQAKSVARNLILAISFEFFNDCRAETKRVSEISELVTKGESPGWQGFSYSDDGIPFITSEHVLFNKIDIDSVKFIPDAFHQKLARSQIKPRDVLVNIVGASIGRAAVVPQHIREANTNQAVAVVRLDEKQIISDYFVTWYLLPTTQQFIASRQVNTARANISLTDIRDFKVPVPEIDLQKSYLSKITSVTKALDALNNRYLRAVEIKKQILNA